MEMLDKITVRPNEAFVMEQWKGPLHLDPSQQAQKQKEQDQKNNIFTSGLCNATGKKARLT